MRPVDEVTRALMFVACALHTPARGATLQELAQAAGVGGDVARQRVRDMRRHGRLDIVRTRRVDYRNRPVAEYAPPVTAPGPDCVLSDMVQAWFTAPAV